MKKRAVFSIVLAALALGAAFVSGDGSLIKKGIVTYADGRVKRKPLDQQIWHNAPVNTDVLSGDKVRTFRESTAELNLADLDVVRLAPKTTVDIVKLYQESSEKKAETKIVVESGDVWAQIHEIEEDTEFDISSGIASAAITGTTLRLSVSGDSTTTLRVYKGEVHFTNAPEKTSALKPKSITPHEIDGPHEVPGPHEVSLEQWLYIVKSMQQITVDKQGKVLEAAPFSLADSDSNAVWVRWNMVRDSLRTGRLQK